MNVVCDLITPTCHIIVVGSSYELATPLFLRPRFGGTMEPLMLAPPGVAKQKLRQKKNQSFETSINNFCNSSPSRDMRAISPMVGLTDRASTLLPVEVCIRRT